MVAISDVAIALIGGRGGAVATQNVLKPHVKQLNAQTPCARGNARGPWVAPGGPLPWVMFWFVLHAGVGCRHGCYGVLAGGLLRRAWVFVFGVGWCVRA